MTMSGKDPNYFTFILADDNSELLVGIRPDGTVSFGNTYSKEAAARVFWECLSQLNPLRPELDSLRQELADLRKRVIAGRAEYNVHGDCQTCRLTATHLDWILVRKP